ncbi:MAG: hypothetical protein U0892_23760 [Pirellulales bacterium]
MLAAAIVWVIAGSPAAAQQIWEYSPYRVDIWLRLDPSLNLSTDEEARLNKHIEDRLAAAFGPAWRHRVSVPPQEMASLIRRGVDQITVTDLAAGEFVLVLGRDSAEANSLRVFDAAVERLPKIAITQRDRTLLTAAAAAEGEPDKKVQMLIEKTTDEYPDISSLASKIEEKQLTAALVRRLELPPFEKLTRIVNTTLPWQTDRMYREYDKVFFVNVGFEGDRYTVESRELDCTIRHFGPTVTRSTVNYQDLAGRAVDAIIASFAPMVRIEEAETRSTKMTMRSGGLILDDLNPARIQLGDVLQPAIRRDDRNGVPNLLQVLPWTYVAVIATDGIQLKGNLYSGIGGGLGGKTNKRMQRVALRVRPTGEKTDVKVSVRQSNKVQAGCAIYERNLADEELEFLGRTDWRGIFTVHLPERALAVLPEAERKRRAEAKRKSEETRAQQALDKANAESKSHKDEEADKSAAGTSNASESETPAAASVAQSGDSPSASPSGSSTGSNEAEKVTEASEVSGFDRLGDGGAEPIPLRQPLVQIYVKSGSTVLAKLPVVPGLSPLESADLPSDERRLEAEAFFRGFQSDLLDLIGMRALFVARIRAHIAARKFEEAEKMLTQLDTLEKHFELQSKLNGIAAKVKGETRGPLSDQAGKRIDLMVQETSETIQKYLEKDIVVELKNEIEKAKSAPPDDGSSDPPANAAGSQKST